MLDVSNEPFLVPFDGTFRVQDADTDPGPDAPRREECQKELKKEVKRIADYQEILFAHDQYAMLLIFQAMDAGGKDGTIRRVATGINPAGCQVYSFRQPSSEELDHDFLWRSSRRLPERGRIGFFNRSYYEEVLVVRVHPEIFEGQRIPGTVKEGAAVWEERFESIRDHERHLARNGTVVLKFWLNVSKEEQRRRFLSRVETPEKNWKFSVRDVEERAYWDDYMSAYEEALRATSRPWAPWYAVPADNKPFARLAVATQIRRTLGKLGIGFPELAPEKVREVQRMRALLTGDGT